VEERGKKQAREKEKKHPVCNRWGRPEERSRGEKGKKKQEASNSGRKKKNYFD